MPKLIIKKAAFVKNKIRSKRFHPLLIGCSGGGGHNSAIEAIQQDLIKNNFVASKEALPDYQASIQRKPENSKQQTQIARGVKLTHSLPVISPVVKKLLNSTSYPVLPDKSSLDNEVTNLINSQKAGEQAKTRKYIDMLLDVYPAGYESAAIWNVLQRQDKVADLKKLIALQDKSDKDNYLTVKNFYVNLLKRAQRKGHAYTELISTQAMALPALCDAVLEYNHWLRINKKRAPKVEIHQYMTDLPTDGAVHFFHALDRLNPQQRQQMKLYGVNMQAAVLKRNINNLATCPFKGVFSIDPKNNPMVRSAFTDPARKNDLNARELKVQVAGQADLTYKIQPHEQIAAVMLGSQASNDTVAYAFKFYKTQDKIFVFGGKRPNISPLIDEFIKNNPDAAEKIIKLDNQDDAHMAPIMSRSQRPVIRGGGLSVMEAMSAPANKNKVVFIHHAESGQAELSSGISWEDANVDALIANLANKGVHAEKTSVERFDAALASAEEREKLISTCDKSGIDNLHFLLAGKNFSAAQLHALNLLVMQHIQNGKLASQEKEQLKKVIQHFIQFPKATQIEWANTLHTLNAQGLLPSLSLNALSSAHHNTYMKAIAKLLAFNHYREARGMSPRLVRAEDLQNLATEPKLARLLLESPYITLTGIYLDSYTKKTSDWLDIKEKFNWLQEIIDAGTNKDAHILAQHFEGQAQDKLKNTLIKSITYQHAIDEYSPILIKHISEKPKNPILGLFLEHYKDNFKEIYAYQQNILPPPSKRQRNQRNDLHAQHVARDFLNHMRQLMLLYDWPVVRGEGIKFVQKDGSIVQKRIPAHMQRILFEIRDSKNLEEAEPLKVNWLSTLERVDAILHKANNSWSFTRSHVSKMMYRFFEDSTREKLKALVPEIGDLKKYRTGSTSYQHRIGINHTQSDSRILAYRKR